MATEATTAAAVVVATTRGQGRITSAVVMAKVDMAVADMGVTASKVEMAMDRVDMGAMVTEETEAATREVDTVVAVAEEVEGDIRNDEMG